MNKAFAYYLEVYEKSNSSGYILQTETKEKIEELLPFYKMISYLDDDYAIVLMGLFGDEEDYDVEQVASEKKLKKMLEKEKK